MKLNIEKFQTGGKSYFHASVNPFYEGAMETATAATTSKDPKELLSKGVMDELIKRGIPNDVDDLMSDLAAVLHDIDLGIGVTTSELYDLKAKANQVILASEYLKSAEKEASKNGALDEVAIDQRGNFYTLNESGNVEKTSLNDFDRSKLLALTVEELIKYRKYSPQFVNNIDVAGVIGTNVGLEKIQDYIKGIIQTVGTSETSLDAYVNVASIVGKDGAKKPTLQLLYALLGISDNLEELGADAIFKETSKFSSKNVEEACLYILSVLPNNMKTQLYGKYVAEGYKLEDANKNILLLITFALGSANTTKSEYKFNYQPGINKRVNPAKSGGSSSKTFYQTPLEAFFDGDFNLTDLIISDNANGNKAGIKVKGNSLPVLTNDAGHSVNNLPLSVALNATIGKYLNYDKIYMGDLEISEGQLQNIVYLHDHVGAIYMPVRNDGRIDWSGFHAYTVAEQEIESKNITDINEKNEIHNKYHSYIQYDSEGKAVPLDNVKKFALIYGYTTDDHVKNENTMAVELTGDEEDEIDDVIDSIYTKKFKKESGIKRIAEKRVWDDIIKVPVFIEINEFATGDAYRYGGHGSSITPNTLQEDMVQEQVEQDPVKKINAQGSLLYQE